MDYSADYNNLPLSFFDNEEAEKENDNDQE